MSTSIPSFWHLLNPKGEQEGPFSSDEMKTKFEMGDIDAFTTVWGEGMTSWSSIKDLDTSLKNVLVVKEDDDDVKEMEKVIEETKQSQNSTSKENQTKRKRRRKKKRKKGENCWVYVKGLPLNITEEDMIQHFSLAGALSQNLSENSENFEIRLYKQEFTKNEILKDIEDGKINKQDLDNDIIEDIEGGKDDNDDKKWLLLTGEGIVKYLNGLSVKLGFCILDMIFL